jgi:hypothetical protein
MTNVEQIAAINAQIVELERVRGQSVDPSERGRLDAQIASLEETRQPLEDAEINSQFPPEGTGAGA